MILANTATAPRGSLPSGRDAQEELAEQAVWLDLVDPTESERTLIEGLTGMRVPTLAELSEIERSSRLAAHGQVLTLSTPMISRPPEGGYVVAPLGFVVSPEKLLTVRFQPMPALDTYAERIVQRGGHPPSGPAAFIGVLEAIVDRLADLLEQIGGELDGLSRQTFRADAMSVHRLRRQSAQYRGVLMRVGSLGDHLSSIRDSLLGISRIVVFVIEAASDWTPPDLRTRLNTARQDLASLNDYDVQITGKVQFLLDATLGFINIQQNNVFKVLTVASIVGIPPTLLASIYGMNFKNMPELTWSFGYEYGLSVILLSAVLPLLWFWWRGWL